MSHFTVLVVGENGRTIEDQLAPFMENCCAEPEKRFLKFFDDETDMLKDYESDGVERVIMPDGRKLLKWDEEFRVKGTFGTGGDTHKVPEGSEIKIIPFKETFATFEDYAREWCGERERDPEHKRFGHWQNPNAKWDWFQIGGRWSGFFQLKPGTKGGLREKSFMLSDRPEGNRADIAYKRDIAFDAMRDAAEERAAKTFDAVQKAIAGTPIARSWEEVHTSYPDEKIDDARKEYHAQPRVKAFVKFARSKEGSEQIDLFSAVEAFDASREQYLKQARQSSIVTFAVLKDGKWYERGEMGWWGIVSDEKDKSKWDEEFSKLLDSLPPETILTVVDCHI